MKTPNTFEEKSKFLAQHWQQVGIFTTGNYVHKKNAPFTIEKDMIHLVSRSSNKVDGALVVYPLATINNSDLKTVLEIQGYDVSNGINREKALSIISPESIIHLSFQAYQFLQRRSFRLPYMDLSIADLYEYGWIVDAPK